MLGTAPPCEDNDAALAALGGCAAAIAVLGCDFVFAGTPIGENCSVSCETYCEGDPIISSNSSGEFTGLGVGTYSVEVLDSSGGSSQYCKSTETIVIDAPPTLEITDNWFFFPHSTANKTFHVTCIKMQQLTV